MRKLYSIFFISFHKCLPRYTNFLQNFDLKKSGKYTSSFHIQMNNKTLRIFISEKVIANYNVI